jgi:hypothetical protein
MANRVLINRSLAADILDAAHEPQPQEDSKSDGDKITPLSRREPWANGFRTFDGTLVRLFIRPAPSRLAIRAIDQPPRFRSG